MPEPVATIESGRMPGAGPRAVRRVLVVDDSRMQRKILSAQLARSGYAVVEAGTAEEALRLCDGAPPDLVISDWMMPGMTGIEFCQRLRARVEAHYVYFILLTSKTETAEIARGLEGGADDFLIKPVSGDELRARIAAGERILRMERELTDKNRLLSAALGELQGLYDSINRDLMQAKKIQESLVPDRARYFGASRFGLLLKPSGHIGGDLVGLFTPGLNQVGFYSLDVSGHGITAALLTARLASYLSPSSFSQNVAMEQRQWHFYRLRKPSEVAAALNARMTVDTGIDEYFTLAYGVADLFTGLVRMVQCGHPHPLLLRADGSVEFLGDGGLPIGMFADAGWQQFEVVLERGDRILLYSDGFTDCPLKDGSMLGADGLARLAGRVAAGGGEGEFLDDLFWCLSQEMAPGAGIEDDISAIVFEFGGV